MSLLDEAYNPSTDPTIDWPLRGPSNQAGSNNRVTNEAGGVKDDRGKIRPDLIDPAFLIEIADVLRVGSEKYSDENWKVVEKKRYVAATMRHLLYWLNGEENDKDDNISHLAHLAADVMFLRWFERNGE